MTNNQFSRPNLLPHPVHPLAIVVLYTFSFRCFIYFNLFMKHQFKTSQGATHKAKNLRLGQVKSSI